jgi:membrane protein required for colicin V production
MFIDIVFAIMLVMACIKGYSKGLIIALFSVLAFIVGLAAAMKLSTVAADYLKSNLNIGAQWLPFLSFILVFLAVVLLVRWGAKLIEKTVSFAMLGWVNKIGGIALYVALYTIILSIILFYAQKINLVNAETIASSKTYGFIQPWGPKAIDGLGVVLPWFKNMFGELQQFFDGVKTKVS